MSKLFEAPSKSAKDGVARSSLTQRGNEPVGWQPSAPREKLPAGFEAVDRIAWRMDPEKRIAAWDGAHPVGAEKFLVLRHRLHQLRRSRPLKTLLVTSAIPREGKTLVATNLAFTLVRTSSHVLLADADLRLPTVHQVLGVEPMTGLTEVLEGRLEARAGIRRLDPSGLYYLPAGHSPANPVELLQSPRAQELLAQTSSAFDWTVIDAPPVSLFADARHLANLVDAVLLVARVGVAPRDSMQQVSAALPGIFIAGVVVNGVVDCAQDRYYYSYYRS
jgi:capsular exopolysaccharide synthesis family protein